MEVRGGQIHTPGALSPEKELHCTHWIGDWVNPSVGLVVVAKDIFSVEPLKSVARELLFLSQKDRPTAYCFVYRG
jgi:hypothetical protein